MEKFIKGFGKYVLIGISILISAILSAYGQDIHDAFPPSTLKKFCSDHIVLLIVIICICFILCIVSLIFDIKDKIHKTDEAENTEKLSKEQKTFLKKAPKFFDYNDDYFVYFDISFHWDGKPDPVCMKFHDKRNNNFYDLRPGSLFTNPVYQDQHIVNEVKQFVKSKLLQLWFQR